MIRSFVCIDLETTGVAPDQNEIIEIGAVKVENGVIVDQFESLVRPKKNPTKFVQRLTGITPKALENAPNFADIAPKFLSFLGESPFVAHNAPFDYSTLNTSLQRMDIAPIQNAIIDTRLLFLILYPEISSHKLSSLTAHFNITTHKKHRALSDAWAVAKLFEFLWDRIDHTHPLVFREAANILPTIDPHIANFFKSLLSLDQLTQTLNYRDVLKATPPANPKIKKGHTIPFSKESIQAILKDVPNLSKFFPSYEFRETQLEMASFVADCLSEGHHGLLEAETGTGKTLAYLIPAMLNAMENDAPIIISTRTKHLQSQLITKDIPKLNSLFNFSCRTVVIKGKENYIDLDRFDRLYAKVKSQSIECDQVAFLGLLNWILSTETGDLSELHPSIRHPFSSLVHYTSDPSGKNTPKHHFFFNRLKKQAKSAHIIITNHAMYFSDLALSGGIFSSSSPIIFDEAHSIPDVVTSAYGHEISQKKLDALGNKAISKAARPFFQAANRSGNEPKIIDTDLILSSYWTDLVGHREHLVSELNRIKETLTETLNPLSEAVVEEQSLVTEIEDLLESIDLIFSLDSDYVVWIERGALFAAPKLPANILKNTVFAEKQTAIFISATLRTKQSFDYFKRTVGLDDPAYLVEDKAIKSEFNLAEQAKVVVPLDLDTPSAETEITAIVRAFNGKTLILCTSLTQLQSLYEALKKRLSDSPIHILCQSIHGGREQLLDKFQKRHSPMILMGVDSFWEGIDIPGKSLSCVVITKLPFPVPNDPLHIARASVLEEKGQNAFKEYYIPLAITKFRQGIGRLIRGKKDKGAIFILDSRIDTKGYGKLFYREIEDYSVDKGSFAQLLNEVLAWYDTPKKGH